MNAVDDYEFARAFCGALIGPDQADKLDPAFVEEFVPFREPLSKFAAVVAKFVEDNAELLAVLAELDGVA